MAAEFIGEVDETGLAMFVPILLASGLSFERLFLEWPNCRVDGEPPLPTEGYLNKTCLH